MPTKKVLSQEKMKWFETPTGETPYPPKVGGLVKYNPPKDNVLKTKGQTGILRSFDRLTGKCLVVLKSVNVHCDITELDYAL